MITRVPPIVYWQQTDRRTWLSNTYHLYVYFISPFSRASLYHNRNKKRGTFSFHIGRVSVLSIIIFHITFIRTHRMYIGAFQNEKKPSHPGFDVLLNPKTYKTNHQHLIIVWKHIRIFPFLESGRGARWYCAVLAFILAHSPFLTILPQQAVIVTPFATKLNRFF